MKYSLDRRRQRVEHKRALPAAADAGDGDEGVEGDFDCEVLEVVGGSAGDCERGCRMQDARCWDCLLTLFSLYLVSCLLHPSLRWCFNLLFARQIRAGERIVAPRHV